MRSEPLTRPLIFHGLSPADFYISFLCGFSSILSDPATSPSVPQVHLIRSRLSGFACAVPSAKHVFLLSCPLGNLLLFTFHFLKVSSLPLLPQTGLDTLKHRKEKKKKVPKATPFTIKNTTKDTKLKYPFFKKITNKVMC